MWLSTVCDRLSSVSPALLQSLLDTACKGAVVLLLAWLVALAIRRASAAARHLVWFLAALSLLLLPLLTAALPGWHILPNWANNVALPAPPVPAVIAVPAPASPRAASDTRLLPNYVPPKASPVIPFVPAPASPNVIIAGPATSPVHLHWQDWLLLAWLMGSLLVLAHFLLACASLHRLKRRSSRITTDSWQNLLSQVCRQLGFHRRVELISSSRRVTPMTWGIWKTWVLVPEDASRWTESQRRAVLMHELAHARRLDCLTQLVARFACAIYWFNPLVWFAWHRMQIERERACDDLVLSTGTLASTYAEQLLQIAAELPAARLSAAAIAMARPGTLEGRLLAILDTRRNRSRVAATTLALAIASVGVLSVVLASLRARDAADNPSKWAASRGWSAQLVDQTTLESKWGGGWRDIPFVLDPSEEADARACIAIAEKNQSSTNGKTDFSDPATRKALEDVLKRRPGYFYAEFLLAQWHGANGDGQQAAALLDAAYQHAPVVVVQRFQFADGSPLVDTPVQSFSLECNRVQKGYLDPSLKLRYFNLRTDADGCIYLPVYNTVYRRDDMASPDGYSVAWPKLGWFETSSKVALLSAAVVSAVQDRPGTQKNVAPASQSASESGFRTVAYCKRDSRNPGQMQHVVIDGAGRERVDYGDGRTLIFDAIRGKELYLQQPIKSAHLWDVPNLHADNPIFSIAGFEKLADADGNPVRLLASKQLAGRLVEGIEFDANGTLHQVWRDSKSQQLVEVDLLVPADPSRGPAYTLVYDQIDLGGKVDDKPFSLKPPAGYQVTHDLTPVQVQQEKDVEALLANSAGGGDSLRLRNARQHLRDLDREYRVGLVTVLDYQTAVWDVKIRQAEQSGSARDAAKARLDKATTRAKLIDAMWRSGLVSVADLHNAQGEVKLRQAELDALVTVPASNPSARQSKVTAVRLENARQRLNDAEQLFRAGLEPELEYERAKWDVQILEAEQSGDAVKAARARLDAATAIAKLVEQLYQAGLGTAADLHDAQGQVKLREAELDALQAPAASPPAHSQPAALQAPTPAATQPVASAAVKQVAGEKISLFVRNGAVQMHMGNTTVEAKQVQITAIGGSVFTADVSDTSDAFGRWVRLRGKGAEFGADRIEISPDGQPVAEGGPIPVLQNAGETKAAGAATTRKPATQAAPPEDISSQPIQPPAHH